jgi:hypothetical protein
LNWISLPWLFSFFQDLGGLGPLAFILINSLCLYVWLSVAATLLNLREPFRSLAPPLSAVALPFLFGWLLAPNKELPTAAAMMLILRQAQLGHTGRVIAFSIFSALFKFQIFIAALLYLLGMKLRYRRSLALIGLSLFLPVVLPFLDWLSMANFLEAQDNQVNTAAFFTMLDQINSWPFGYVVVAPIRFAANLFVGLLPYRVAVYSQPADLFVSLTSIPMAYLAVLCLLKAISEGEIQRQIRSTSRCGYFLFCTILAFSLVPFLQPRYYWWATPLLIGYLLKGHRISTSPPAGAT